MMTRCLLSAAALGLTLAVSPSARAAQPSDAALSCVRLHSHGVSGTMIATGPGWTKILTCAHGFSGRDGRPSRAAMIRPIYLDVPRPQGDGRAKQVGVKLLDVDFKADLALVQLNDGPLPVCPVAAAGHRPGRNVVSLGYDEMRLLPTLEAFTRGRHATLIGGDGSLTFTREPPWHGRSGGGLIDLDGGLIGVVHGYEMPYPRGHGLYVSHTAIVAFLGRQGQPIADRRVPEYQPQYYQPQRQPPPQEYRYFNPQPRQPEPQCPT